MGAGELESRPAAYVLSGVGAEKYLYKGACRDLKARIQAHMGGKVSRTRNRRPLELVYFEYVTTYSEALVRERFLKSGIGRAFLKTILVDSNAQVAERQTQGT